MHELVLQPLIDECAVAQPAHAIYVVDADFVVLLRGTTPNDLFPALGGDARLPLDVHRIVRRIVTGHDFASEAVARAASGKRTLHVLRLAGPAGKFYAVVTRARTLRGSRTS